MRVRAFSVATALVMVLAACSDSSSSETTASTSATTVAAPATTASPQSTASTEADTKGLQAFPSPGLLRPEELPPGQYTTTIMTPTITLTVGEGWQILGEFEPLLLMSRTVGFQGQEDFLNFVTFPGNSIDAVIDGIQHEEVLDYTDPVLVSVGEAEGLSFTAGVMVPGGGSVEVFTFPNNRLYNRVPLDPPTFDDGDRIRFTVLEVGTDVLTIISGADDLIDFDAFLEAADEVLATVSFRETVTG